jgi:hypothetical protein
MTTSTRQDHLVLEYRLRLQRAVTSVARDFVGLRDLDDAIDIALAETGAVVDADRAYLFQFANNGALVNNTHE